MSEREIEERPWSEFQEAGLLWWINRSLHLFGWAIVVEMNDDGHIERAYPARCKFRGFAPEAETRGFRRLTTYLARQSQALLKGTYVETASKEQQHGDEGSDEDREEGS